MSYPAGDPQSAQDDGDREGELLCLKIKTQLEDLFSDSHLAKNCFLLKHVQKNKQGYVSLKLLTCLKQIKVLTTNWCTTLAAAENSDVLEVNAKCTKVRRREPLPKWLLCSPTTKLLLAWNISVEETAGGPEHLSLSEGILQKFSAHGSIASVWILHPGEELPKELQCYAKRHKKLGRLLCAVVKFDHLEAVREAYIALKAEEQKSNGEGMHVEPLGFQSVHPIAKKEPTEENKQDPPERSQENPHETSGDSAQAEPSSPVKVSDETPDPPHPGESSENPNQRTSEQIIASCSSHFLSGLNQRYIRMSRCSGNCDKGNFQSPWVLRRKLAASALNPKVAGHLNALRWVQRVLRQPFGPDGTKGFHSRGRPLQGSTLPCVE
ncbi:la-related protein 6b [Chelmon rostratus]|uniref:la-related protein 6b n=1 Tax=Chelmon rostratus TaxID=109905 RepID=UPI001BEA6392|nr:la-related protein 6b [Chelmon rostratus]